MNRIRNLAPYNIADTSTPFRLPARIWLGGFMLVAVIILMAGCGDDRAPDHAATNVSPSLGTSPVNNEQASTVVFPRHGAPLN
jgi:hypothetical protein